MRWYAANKIFDQSGVDRYSTHNSIVFYLTMQNGTLYLYFIRIKYSINTEKVSFLLPEELYGLINY